MKTVRLILVLSAVVSAALTALIISSIDSTYPVITSDQHLPVLPLKGTIIVGSKEFTEELILGNIMKLLLEQNGFAVNDRIGLSGTMTNHMALVNGDIDVYMEYTGTAYTVILKQTKPIYDPHQVYEFVKKEYEKRWNLTWLRPANFDNSNALVMKKDESDRLGIKTISELALYVRQHPEKLSFATNAEFLSRPDGLTLLEKHYGFAFPQDKIVKMDIGLTYVALNDGKVDVAMGFSTDAAIKKFGLATLDDDKRFFPIYNPAPVVRQEVLDRYPQVKEILDQIGPRLTTDQMILMNYEVEVEGHNPQDVAREWLQKEGLVVQNNNTSSVIFSSSTIQNIGYLVQKISQHLEVSAISVAVAILIGLGLGTVLASVQSKIIPTIVLTLVTIIFTIPSIAMFGFMMPIFGLGLVPSIIALVLYAQIPILRNTYTGLSNVSSSIINAAEGLGLDKQEILFKIKFPMAAPVIMAGIRSSVVLTIGIATIASLIGAGGLGDMIFHGIEQGNTELILTGTIPVAVLAVTTDLGLKFTEVRFTSRGIK